MTGLYKKEREDHGPEGLSRVVYQKAAITPVSRAEAKGRPTPDFLPREEVLPTRGDTTIPWESEAMPRLPTPPRPKPTTECAPELSLAKAAATSTVHHIHYHESCTPVHSVAHHPHSHSHTWHQPCATAPSPQPSPCVPCPAPPRDQVAPYAMEASSTFVDDELRIAQAITNKALATAANVNAAAVEFVLEELEAVKRTCQGRSPYREEKNSSPSRETPAKKPRRRR